MGGYALATRPDQFMFRVFMSNACWSGTGDIYKASLCFRQAGKGVYIRSESLLTDLFEYLWMM